MQTPGSLPLCLPPGWEKAKAKHHVPSPLQRMGPLGWVQSLLSMGRSSPTRAFSLYQPRRKPEGHFPIAEPVFVEIIGIFPEAQEHFLAGGRSLPY